MSVVPTPAIAASRVTPYAVPLVDFVAQKIRIVLEVWDVLAMQDGHCVDQVQVYFHS